MIYNTILETIGKTPIVKLNRLVPKGSAEVFCKLESFNPMSSIKDRIALAMIEDAEKKGLLNKDTYVVEPTSGNTGIGLAMVCAVKGYRLILTMPESMSIERRKMLATLGAQIVLTPASEGMMGAIERAKEICKSNPNCFMPQQFNNPVNPETHMKTTAIEILEDIPSPDAFVAGVGTGGTITGVGKVLKERNNKTKIVAVEPFSSAVLSGGRPGVHGIQGIGAGFVPKILDLSIVDQVIPVKDSDARMMTLALAREEGIFAGISSGAAVFGALQVAKELGDGKKVVTILPDTGERYLSTDVFLD